MNCECGHDVNKHDSGGCCREAFCDCSTLRPIKLEQQEAKPAPKDYFLDYNISAAPFNELAKWAFKAQEEIRSLRGLKNE